MGIDTIFICHFFYPDLRIEIFFEKEEAVEQSDVDFEIGVNASTAK